ncbi:MULTISPECIES: TIGR02266 family protein [unclassified Anaeromyxobacter]|uniref:TIGR02266 family protein n=1 Tax=unclassified Anaeromyxobacter TaxID=2620896 RepID=UPI001F5AB7D5|nr:MULTISPECIES: TIGR02266 family protein [unclassified Anaeromyxobacter]
MEGPHDKRGGGRTPVGLAVRLSYGTIDELVERFAVNISRGGVFIRTRAPRPVGTRLALELRLSGGEAAIRGEGVVRWIQAEDPAAHPRRAPGMGVQFTRLDDASRALVERMVELKERRGVAPGVIAPAPIAARPDGTPAPTRAPDAALPTALPTPPPPSAPPVLTPLPAAPSPAQADLAASHRVEQLQAGPARIDLGLPDAPRPVTRPSRAIIGIDLGTSNSCAAVVKDGRPYVIPSREGHATVPSIVGLNARQRVVVGHLARSQLLTNPKTTVSGAKRLIGRAWDTPLVQEIREKYPYEIVPGDEGLAAVRLGPETVSLEQISALVLGEVRDVAQNHLREEVNRAVVTVPAYYNERQRAAVRHAAALAGIQVERILNEPTAAALAYAYGRHLNQRVLVYDLGGGTFDASVLELSDNVYEVVSTGGDTFLGGVDFDDRIVERLLAIWEERTGAPFPDDRVALSRLVDAAERAKCALSERAEFPVSLPFLALRDGAPVALEAVLTRDEIVALVEPLVDRTLDVCREVLLAKGLGTKDIDEVLLVGGQSRMPLVHRKVAAFFGRPPSHAVHPDEAVALGAALLAHSLGSAEGVVLIDVLPMSIGIGLPGGRVKTIIERNTPLPARKQYGLTTTRDGQTEFELAVFQGESRAASECEYLGTLRLEGLPPGPRGMVKIAVSFELGPECLLTVTARELNTGREVQAVMSAGEGAEAARRKLEQGGGADAARAQTGNFPAPGSLAAGAADPAVAAASAGGALGGLFRRIFGRRPEAR